MGDTIVPVRNNVGNRIMGRARISERGDIINIELNEDLFPRIMMTSFREDLAQGLKLSIDYTPAVPATKETNDNE